MENEQSAGNLDYPEVFELWMLSLNKPNIVKFIVERLSDFI